jgi:hypothetical protein
LGHYADIRPVYQKLRLSLRAFLAFSIPDCGPSSGVRIIETIFAHFRSLNGGIEYGFAQCINVKIIIDPVVWGQIAWRHVLINFPVDFFDAQRFLKKIWRGDHFLLFFRFRGSNRRFLALKFRFLLKIS